METPVSVSVAKKLIRSALSARGLENKLTTKTIDFSDLARASCVFVVVHGWSPDPFAAELEKIARENGFRVTFKGGGFAS